MFLVLVFIELNKTMLTGNKDVDRKILNNLEDIDLVNLCQTNKKANSLCNDQVFWMNRVFHKFGYVGGDVLRKNKKDRSWSEYYIKDLRKINSTNADKYLLTGSKNNRLDYVIIALKNGADIHGNNDWALRLASRYGHLEIVKYLVSQGADIHALSDWALGLASETGQLEVVKYLVSLGADIHKYNNYALRQASENGQLEVVKYLVSQGADIHRQNDYTLRQARLNNHTEVVKYLESLE